MAQVKVVQNPEAEVPQEVLAQAIVDISTSLRKLLKSGLNRKAIVALVKDDTHEHKTVIEHVLTSLEDLSKTYCGGK